MPDDPKPDAKPKTKPAKKKKPERKPPRREKVEFLRAYRKWNAGDVETLAPPEAYRLMNLGVVKPA